MLGLPFVRFTWLLWSFEGSYSSIGPNVMVVLPASLVLLGSSGAKGKWTCDAGAVAAWTGSIGIICC